MEKIYIPVKKSQMSFFEKTPLYYFSKEGESLLYKKKGIKLDKSRIQSNKYPELFIHKSDQKDASRELREVLNFSLASAIASKGLVTMKSILCEIVEEALSSPLDSSLDMLPETLEILFKGYSENKTLLESLFRISSHSSVLIHHTVNILSITMQYCFFNKFAKSDIKLMGICAILHDIGCIEIEQKIVETENKLTEREFRLFKTHTSKGYKIINNRSNFEKEIALVALEHHEKLDGSGYPSGRTKISEAAQLIGLIDSYEPLTYRNKNFRQAQNPFNSLHILKREVMRGQYNKKMFINLCSCLTR